MRRTLDTLGAASLWLPKLPRNEPQKMRLARQTWAMLTDSHFLIPLVVFGIGLALLVTLH